MTRDKNQEPLGEGFFAERVFTQLELGAERVERAEFEGCRFERCRFDETRFVNCRFTECAFVESELVAVRFTGSRLADVRFEGGRAMGVDFTGAQALTLRLAFEGARLDYAQLSDLPLSGTVFARCHLVEATFDGCDLREAVFDRCDLSRAVIRQADLRGARFKGCRGARIDHASCRLGDTQVDAETALVMLEAQGVRCDELRALLGWSEGR